MSTDKRNLTSLPIQHRAAKIEPPTDTASRQVTFALSSEMPVRQWFGNERLMHGKDNVRQERLKSGMVPLLFNHDPSRHLGVVNDYEIKDGVLRVTATFGNSPLATEKLQDVRDGVLRAASAGYRIHKMVRTEDEDNPNAPDNCDVTDWEPYDASLVTVPADPSVGVGRSTATDNEFPVDVETIQRQAAAPIAQPSPPVEVIRENPNPQPTLKERSIMAETAVVPSADAVELRRTQEILAVAGDKDFGKYFSFDDAQRAIKENTPAEKVRENVTRKIVEANDATKVGTAGDNVFTSLSQKEQKRYSITRMVRSLVNEAKSGTFSAKDADAGFEREISAEIKRHLHVQTNGPLIPNAAYRALGTQAISATTNQIATTSESAVVSSVTSPEVIELLRHRARVIQLGARVLGGLQGVVRLPRQTGANTASWVTEGLAGAAADLTTDFISLTPRRLSQQTSWTIELLAEASPDVEGLARADLDKVRNLALDLAAISGSGGSGQPTGILATSGLATLNPSGSAFADGGQPLTFNDILAFESLVSAADADASTSGWLFTPEVRAQLKGTPKFAAGLAEPVWKDGPYDPLGLSEGPLGYRAGVTNQLAKNGTKSGVTGSILHTAIFGDFSQLIMADWGASEMVVDPYTQAANGAVVVTARSLHDIGVRHIAAFAASKTIAVS